MSCQSIPKEQPVAGEYVITINSTCDLPKDWVWERKIPVVPLNCTIGDKTYRDMYDLSADEFYGMLRAGATTVTSQPSPQDAMDILEPILKEGKDILHLAFSSGLSGTYNSMRIAAEELQEKYPERKIVVIDTLCASMGEGLVDYKALELQKEGKSLEEVAQWVEENKLKVCHFFMVDDLNHLQKGGRISKTAAVLGTMVQIKPVIYLDNEGKLQIIRKERGRKKGMNKIVDMAIEATEGKTPDMVMIPHGNCPEDAAYVAELVKKKMGVTNIMMNNLGTVIGGHTGAGMIAVVCMAEHR